MAQHQLHPRWCDWRVTTGGGASSAQVWGALGSVYVLWGSTYLGIAIIVSAAPPLLSAGSRFIAAGLIVAAIVAVRSGWRTLRIARRELLGPAVLAVLLLCAGNGGVSLAARYVPSSVTALLVASVPLFIVCLRALNHDRPRAMTWAGVAFGLVGVVALVIALGRDDPAPGDGYIDLPGWQVGLWLLVVLCGSVSWAYGSFLSPRIVAAGRAPRDSGAMVTWQFLIAGVLLTAIGLLRGEGPGALDHVDGRTVGTWAFIVCAGVIAYSAYTWLLQNASVSLASTYAYVNPVVAMLLGWWLLSEPMTSTVLAAAVLIIIGVLLVVRSESRNVASSRAESADRVDQPEPADSSP